MANLEGNTLRAKLVETTPAQGMLGFKGETGASAYDIAVKYGFEGTEEEWIEDFGIEPTNYVNKSEIKDNLTTNDATKVLSAKQGYVLKQSVDNLNSTLAGQIGTLSNLTTTAKTNLVAAVNEVNASVLTFDDIYPVGSIYMSVSSTSPASLFGGTWEQLKDRFLLGDGTTYTAGNTGGEATHTLTVNEIPSHNHGAGTGSSFMVYSGSLGFEEGSYYTRGNQNNTGYTGGGQAHNNLPPYLVVYMWKRTA